MWRRRVMLPVQVAAANNVHSPNATRSRWRTSTSSLELLPTRAESENSWSVSREQIDANNYDLKAVNPNRPTDTDTRTPAELLEEIEAHGRELADALADLRQALRLEE